MYKIFNAEQYSKKVAGFEGKRKNDYNPFFDKANVVVSRLHYNKTTKEAEFVNLFINKDEKCLTIDKFILKDDNIYVSTIIPDEGFNEDFMLIPSIAISGIGVNDEAHAWLNLEQKVNQGAAEEYLKAIIKTIDNPEFAKNLKKYCIQRNTFHQKWHEYQDKISIELKKINKLENTIEKLNKKVIELSSAQKKEAVEPKFQRIKIKLDDNSKNRNDIEFKMEQPF